MTLDRATEQSIGWLMSDVARLLRRDFDRRVQALGLTQAQWRAIAHLAREEGINQAELAERLEVTPISIARLIDRMERAGWVERVADESDRRASRLFLTDSVQPILEEIREVADGAVKDVMRGIAKSNRNVVVKALQQMKRNLTSAQDTPATAAAKGK